MTKRIVIAGTRTYHNYEEAKAYIDLCIREIRKQFTLVFLSGECSGADRLGERYAAENGFAIERYPAEWEKYGKAAGPMRNEQMAQAADYVICFWDGKSRGTYSMIQSALANGKPIKVKRYTE